MMMNKDTAEMVLQMFGGLKGLEKMIVGLTPQIDKASIEQLCKKEELHSDKLEGYDTVMIGFIKVPLSEKEKENSKEDFKLKVCLFGYNPVGKVTKPLEVLSTAKFISLMFSGAAKNKKDDKKEG